MGKSADSSFSSDSHLPPSFLTQTDPSKLFYSTQADTKGINLPSGYMTADNRLSGFANHATFPDPRSELFSPSRSFVRKALWLDGMRVV